MRLPKLLNPKRWSPRARAVGLFLLMLGLFIAPGERLRLPVFVESAAQIQPAGPSTLNFRNFLDNGAFDVAQRGTTAITGVNTTPTYLWDRWAAYANNGAASVTLTNITVALPNGFANAAQIQRVIANSNTQPICLVQEIPSADVVALQGQPVVLSFWAEAGSTFSAANFNLTVQINTGTGTDQGLAALLAGWTGATSTSTTIALTTGFQRYPFTTSIPANATEAAVQFCWTPTGTAGALDLFQITGVQLEFGTLQTTFERKPFGIELAKDQRYFWQLTESNSVLYACAVTGANAVSCPLPLPLQMRAAPTATVTAGGFQLIVDGAAPTGISGQSGGTGSVNTCVLATTNTITGAVHSVTLRGSGTTGKVLCSADF